MSKFSILFTIFISFVIVSFAQEKPMRIIYVGKPPTKDTIDKRKYLDTTFGSNRVKFIPVVEDKAPPEIVAKKNVKPNTHSKWAPLSNSGLRVKIRLQDRVVSTLNKVVVYITVTNASRSMKEVVFDKPYRPDAGPWFTNIELEGGSGKKLVKSQNRDHLNPQKMTTALMTQNRYLLKPMSWVMRAYKLQDLVEFELPFEGSLRLPSGNYTVQINYMGINS